MGSINDNHEYVVSCLGLNGVHCPPPASRPYVAFTAALNWLADELLSSLPIILLSILDISQDMGYETLQVVIYLCDTCPR